jgi:hypothetical protein
MPTMPYPTNTDIAVQNNTTGQVDYLQFQGSTLVKSDTIDYAGPGWNVVAQGSYGGPVGRDLIVQNQSSGFLDILKLDAHGNLVGSTMSNVAVPHVVGQGNFNSSVTGQVGSTLVSQLPDGELDMLAFNSSGQLIHSDLVTNTMGLPTAVGVGESYFSFPLFAGKGTGTNDSIVTQLADGSIDDIGLSGDFNAATLSFSASLLLPGSVGMAPVQALNQEYNLTQTSNFNIPLDPTGANLLEGVQLVQQLSNGTFNNVFADSGYGDAAHEGTIYASNQLNLAMPGWHVVDAGGVATGIFPIT